MIVRVILLAAFFFIALNIISYLKRQPPAERKKLLWKYGIWGLAGVMLLLAITGRMHWIGAAVAGAFAIVKMLGPRLFTLLPMIRKMKGSTFTNPMITTRFLKVSINLKTQELNGEIISGDHQGKKLGELSLEQLQQLVVTYQQQDAESARLLTAYLYRYHGRTHQESAQGERNTPPVSGNLDRREALQILGLTDEANEKDIVQAHRRLMQKMHPDRGGSDYLAAKINQAKDFLLNT